MTGGPFVILLVSKMGLTGEGVIQVQCTLDYPNTFAHSTLKITEIMYFDITICKFRIGRNNEIYIL